MKPKHALLLAAGLGLAARELWLRSRELDLRGRAVFITGGSRGLGLALAREFAAHGARIALCARKPGELERARAELASRGTEVWTFLCDVGDPTQVQAWIDGGVAHFGQIDILVNNAGIIQVGPEQVQTRRDYEDAMAINFWGVYNTIEAALPHFRTQGGGRIVNITSVGGKVSVPHLLPYSCAKFAATALSEGLRTELAREKIAVTTVVPGLMRAGSHLSAEFKGNHAGEFAWFSISDNTPGLSVSIETAAKAVVQAARRGEAERFIGLPARLAAQAQGAAPSVTSAILTAVNERVLPAPPAEGGDKKMPGYVVEAEQPSAMRDALTALGRRAAETQNQPGGRTLARE